MSKQDVPKMLQAVNACVRQWLESLGLHGFEPLGDADGPGQRCASISIKGPTAWNLEVRANDPLLRYVAMEMTGAQNKAVDDGLLDDILREFANTVAGNLYPILEGARSLSIPQSTAAKGQMRSRVSLGSNGMAVQVAVLTDEAQANS